MKILSYVSIFSKFFRKKYPFQITHFITSKCNARCKHCFYWKKLNKKNKELTLDEIKKISRTMPRFFSLILTGGEPFLRNDLSSIAKIYYNNNHIENLGIPTNGLLTNKIYLISKNILESCSGLLFTVSLSLDGIGKDHDDSRNTPGNFEKVCETYKKLTPLKKKYKNFNVNFLTTVSMANQDKLKIIHEYVKDKFNADVTMIMIRGNPKNPKSKNIDIANYDAINSIQKDKFKNLESFNHPKLKLMIRKRMHKIRSSIISRTIKEQRYLIPCYAGRLDAVIDEEGTVYPCEMLSKSMGNLKDFGLDFKKLWGSEQAKSIREFIKKSKCFCTHECNMRTNILFNPRIMLGGKIA